jgi:hypothetical protein
MSTACRHSASLRGAPGALGGGTLACAFRPEEAATPFLVVLHPAVARARTMATAVEAMKREARAGAWGMAFRGAGVPLSIIG